MLVLNILIIIEGEQKMIVDNLLYNDKDKTLVEKGEYQGYEYFIVSYGTHPCCYVSIPKEDILFYNKDYNDLDICIHGGLTYSQRYLWCADKTGWFIGWDYSHCYDYRKEKYFSEGLADDMEQCKVWTIDELRNHCQEVIKQIKTQNDLYFQKVNSI